MIFNLMDNSTIHKDPTQPIYQRNEEKRTTIKLLYTVYIHSHPAKQAHIGLDQKDDPKA